MVLFSHEGVIKKYETVGEILDEFCLIRYELYVKRKEYILEDFKQQLKILKNKMRFLKEVMEGSLEIQDVDETLLVKELEKRGYDKKHEKSEDTEKDEKDVSNYQYLLTMHIRSFTKQKLEFLQNEIDKIEKEVARVKKTSPEQMWTHDLDEFESEYHKLYDDVKENSKENAKEKEVKEMKKTKK